MTPRSNRAESPWIFVTLTTAVIAIGLVLWYAIVRAYPRLSDRADFGNLFGGINTLFAGLAFAALVYTLVLQQRALSLQQSEIEAQRKELVEQNRRQARQAVETMLVQLLSFHHDIANAVQLHLSAKDVIGRAALRILADELNHDVASQSQRVPGAPSTDALQRGYEAFYGRHRGVLDHYFRNLYHIIKFVDQSGVETPRRYTSLVRAQLSPAELLLLFYNGLTPRGEKFKPLIEKYALLEQLPDSEIAMPGYRALYQPSAYT